jgi:hypothetical protein
LRFRHQSQPVFQTPVGGGDDDATRHPARGATETQCGPHPLAEFRFNRAWKMALAPTDDCPLSRGPPVGHSKPDLVIDCDPLER